MAKVDQYLGVIRSGTTVKGAPYVLSKLIVDGKEAQTFDTHIQVGDEGELSYDDKYKNWQFSKSKSGETKRKTTAPPAKYTADPKKLKQEFTLEVARNLSIQRQVALKGVVDLMVAGTRKYADLVVTFDDLMELLNKLHYTQVKDEVPTEAEVDNPPPFDDEDVPFED